MDRASFKAYRTTRGHRVTTPEGRVTSRMALQDAGAWSPTQGLLVTSATRCHEVALAVLEVLPAHCVLSHVTAARLHGLPLPSMWTPHEPVHVSVEPPLTPPRRRGVKGHRVRGLTVAEVGETRCTSLAQTWAQMAVVLGEADHVALTDAVLGRRCPVEGLVTPDLLASRLRAGSKGNSRALRALAQADAGAASAPESRLRLLVLTWGVPAPAVNAPVLDVDGQWLATGDLVWRDQRVVLEYEGDHHRTDRRQWQHDISRTRLLEAAGWAVIRATARDLRRPAQLREALLVALARGRADGERRDR